MALLRHFEWNHVELVTGGDAGTQWGEGIKSALETDHLDINHMHISGRHTRNVSALKDILVHQIGKTARSEQQ